MSKQWPRCKCGGVAVYNASRDITRTCIRCGSIVKPCIGQPPCPHCGGAHWGQRFDDCPYLKLATDETATKEQRANSAEWLRLHKENQR